MVHFSLYINTCSSYAIWESKIKFGQKFLHPQKHALKYTYASNFHSPPRYSLSAGEPSKRLKAMHSFPPYLRIPASCQFSSSAFCTFIGPVLLLTMQANCWKWFFMFLLMLTNLPCCFNCHLQSQALSDDQAKVQPALRKIRCHTPQLRRLIKQQWNHSHSARFIYFHGSE